MTDLLKLIFVSIYQERKWTNTQKKKTLRFFSLYEMSFIKITLSRLNLVTNYIPLSQGKKYVGVKQVALGQVKG